MDRGVIGMPFDLAMSSALTQRQFYSRAQLILAERDHLRAEVEALRGLLTECRPAVLREVEKWTRAAALLPVSANVESALLARIDAALAAKEVV